MVKTEKEIAILEGTLQLIAERGFHNTPISAIAKTSGVSAGIIYHYFDNKDALIHALYRDIKARFVVALLEGNQDLAWETYFEQMWLNAFNFYVSNPTETLFIEQYENSPYFVEHFSEAGIQEMGDENFIALMNAMQEKIQAGIVIDMPLVILYEMTFGVALGLAKRQIQGVLIINNETLQTIAVLCRQSIET